MFVKNLVTVSVSTMYVNISHDSSQLYAGAISDVPFYLLNEKVLEIKIIGSTLTVKI